MTTADITFVDGLYDLIDSYDGFLLDQWGVLHNGTAVYDGVLDALKRLKKEGKQVIILSNSAKRASYNAENMEKLGIKPSLYKAIVSSGELTWHGLKEKHMEPFDKLGERCYLICKPGDHSIVEETGVELVDSIDDADFMVISGFDGKQETLDQLEVELKKAVAKHLHVICANPDMVTIQGNERGIGPGVVAQRYQELGGVVHYVGKPYKTIFRHALSLFDNIIPSRVVMVGDSIQHDVVGAMNVDLDAAFVTRGVHVKEFKADISLEEKQKVMDRVCKNYGGIYPKYFMDSLVWQTPAAAAREREREKNDV